MTEKVNPRVLVVDDEKELLKLVGILLKRINVESIPIADGASALDWLEAANRPDLIILDLMLPGIDGFEVLRRIRTRKDMDAVPVLILSAKADPTTIRTALDGGADGYITKTYLATSLVPRVQTLLNAGRTH